MVNLYAFLCIYLFGGVTFIPLVLLCLYWIQQKLQEAADCEDNAADEASKKHDPLLIPGINSEFKAGYHEESRGVDVSFQGWLFVTRKYYYHSSELSDLVQPNSHLDEPSADSQKAPITSANEAPLQRSQLKKKHRYYAILKHGNLFLYRDDSPHANLVHAVALQGSFVTIWPRDPQLETTDSSLFTKRTCLGIFRNGTAKLNDEGVLSFDANSSSSLDNTDQSNNTLSNASQFYLYFSNNVQKEDWYFALINASKSKNETGNLSTDKSKTLENLDPNFHARTSHLNTRDMLYLIQTINSTEQQLTTKWLNALLGRLFLSLQETQMLKDVIHRKIFTKLTKINKPGFLDDLVIEQVDVGNSVPIITNPKLKELSPNGHLEVTMNIQYKGNLSIIVATKVNINLGSHFKPREVAVQLSIKVRELSGPLILIMKPPPSNRIWYAFETDPVLDLEIEPVVSSSKLSYTLVTNAIRSKFAEAIKESLVMPFMDDIVFFSTEDRLYRGGIWDEAHSVSISNNHVMRKGSGAKPEKIVQRNKSDHLKIPKEVAMTDDLTANENSSVEDARSDTSQSRSSFKTKLKLFKNSDASFSQDIRIPSNEDSSSVNSVNSESEVPVKAKKLFKNSMKKFNKWYKDTINNNTQDLQSLTNDNDVSLEHYSAPVQDSTKFQRPKPPSQFAVIAANFASDKEENKQNVSPQPQMISNRRPLPKRPSIPKNLTIKTNDEEKTTSSDDLLSPKLTASEMFAKQRNISVSSAPSGHSPIASPIANSNLFDHDSPSRFAKVLHDDFDQI